MGGDDGVCRKREECCRDQDACEGMSGDERKVKVFKILNCVDAKTYIKSAAAEKIAAESMRAGG